MKVCLLTRYFDLRLTGIERFSRAIYNGLKEKGVQVTGISTSHSSLAGYFLYTALEIPFKLPRGYDIYHALNPVEAMYLPKERSIVTFHDLFPIFHLKKPEYWSPGKFNLPRRYIAKEYFVLASRLASRCKIIACVSEQTKNDVALYLNIKDETKLRVVRHGISPQLKPQERKDRVFRIGTLSFLVGRKRIDLLITGFRQANIDAELVIGGTGPDGARLRALANEDKRIRFLGFVPDDRLVEFYNSLDIFVFPTATEGYGLPMVEAMACQKPVVVLEDAIIPEEIKSRCIVVESLAEFFKNPKIHINIEDNYRFAKRHSWETCVEEYLKLYQEVLP